MQEEQENQNLHYWGNTSEEDYYKSYGVKGSTSFYTSPRDLSLFTRSWLPLPNPPHRGIICMIHGYDNDISWTFQSTPIFLGLMLNFILTFVAKFMPTLPIVPTTDLIVKSVKVEEKVIIAERNPMRYRGKPRLGTVLDLLRVIDQLSQQLSKVSRSFIVLHGSANVGLTRSSSSSIFSLVKYP